MQDSPNRSENLKISVEATGKAARVPRRVGGKLARGKAKDGRPKWQLRIFRGYDAAGKRMYYTETYIGGSKQADARLAELYNRLKSGLPLRYEQKAFKDFFDEWLKDRDDGNIRESTVAYYSQMGNSYLLPAFGHYTLTDITDIEVKRFYKKLRDEGYAPATISTVHVILSNIFKIAERRELVLRNPMRNVDGPSRAKPNPVAMRSDETRAYLEAAATNLNGFMARLALFLGARPCEYLGLKWGDIDFKDHTVTIRRSLKFRKVGDWYVVDPKTEKGTRSISLMPEIVAGFEAHRQQQLEQRMKCGASWSDHGFVFTDQMGEPLHFSYATKIHKQILAAAGLPDTFKLKVTRHSCASAMLRAGVPLKIASERMGHSSIAVTLDVYTAIEPDQQRDASERLGEVLGMGKK